eukprot:9701047-Karenia_brevis.AAC.1
MGSTAHMAMTPQAHAGARVDDNDGEAEADDDDSESQLGKGILPLAWRMEQMRMEERMMNNMRKMMVEVVREEMVQGLKEVKEDMQEVKKAVERANEKASAAQEAVRALRAEVAKSKEWIGQGSRQEHERQSGADAAGSGGKGSKRDREMAVTGFKRNTAGDIIKKQLEEIEAEMGVAAHSRFPVGALSSKGILQFATMEDKEKFQEALREKRFEKSFDGSRLYIEDNNLSQDERAKRRAVGK